jgi:hypothetical protein
MGSAGWLLMSLTTVGLWRWSCSQSLWWRGSLARAADVLGERQSGVVLDERFARGEVGPEE